MSRYCVSNDESNPGMSDSKSCVSASNDDYFSPYKGATSTVSIKTQDLKGFPAEGGNHEAKNTVEYNQPMQAGS